MREARVGCQDHTHDHRRIVWLRAVDRDDTPGADVLFSLWLCPVFHQIGAWAGFPLPGEDEAEAGDDEPRRRGPLRRD